MSEKNVVTAIRDALHDEMAATTASSCWARTSAPAAACSGSPTGWMEEFGEERVIDTPLAESGIVGVAIGMALHGLLPVAEIQFADFIHPGVRPDRVRGRAHAVPVERRLRRARW